MVDKNLFLYNLAVVAILKNEGHYLKEWLDYHILAGVEHFYLYDNDSPDNQAEVAKPYVEAGLVDYFPAPGKVMQCATYNETVKRFKFQSRYMAFIDGDEFIYPKLTGGGIIDVVDEILPRNPNAAGLAVNWQMFGSNGQEKADYSRGVMERFTRRYPKPKTAPKTSWIKTVANPRKINFYSTSHCPFYFEGCYSVNENGNVAPGQEIPFVHAEKIILNHYHTKSHEEYLKKIARGPADGNIRTYERYAKATAFEPNGYDGEFDDGILRYRDERAKTFKLPDKSQAPARLLNALTTNLSPTLLPTTPPQFYAGKMETFLTCRAVAEYLKTHLTDAEPAKFFEEAALKAILRTLASGGMTFADVRLLLRELPNLLGLPYPVTKDLRDACLNIIPQLMKTLRENIMWRDYVELDYLQSLLKLI